MCAIWVTLKKVIDSVSMRLQDVLIHQCPSKGTLDLIASRMRFKLASRTFAAGLFSSDDGWGATDGLDDRSFF